jgi:cation diffusion facilitator CzcD-associated flavoprotein CzcO
VRCTSYAVGRAEGLSALWQANGYSQLTVCEMAYRFPMDYPNGLPSDYTQADELLRNAERFADEAGLRSKVRFGHRVVSVKQTEDSSGGVIVSYTANGGQRHTMQAKAVYLSTGAQTKRREITWRGEEDFGGAIYYGSGNDVQLQTLTGKRVVIVGGGAFAAEQTRMALLSGAQHVTIVARSGMTCIPRLADFWRTVGGRLGDLLDVTEHMREWSGFEGMLPFRPPSYSPIPQPSLRTAIEVF